MGKQNAVRDSGAKRYLPFDLGFENQVLLGQFRPYAQKLANAYYAETS